MVKPESGNLQADLMSALKFQQAGQLLEAEKICRQILRQNPDYLHALLLLGVIARQLGDCDASIILIKQVIAKEPDSPVSHMHLGLAYQTLNKFPEAIEMYEHALELKPDYVDVHNNLGIVLMGLGRYSEAMSHYQKALLINPDNVEAHSNLLFVLSYHVQGSAEEALLAHKGWDAAHSGAGKAFALARPVESNVDKRDSTRRLRIGYVSPDLRQHAVSHFFEPVLDAHNRSEVEVFCYAEVKRPDAVTQRLQGKVDHWRSTVGMSDEDAARLIYKDQIDVLIDLAGHTAGNRLKVFTYKPAPIQATYLGYCATTGLEAMDYWISDEVLHPEDTVELATEARYRLPRCWLCYRPNENAPAVELVEVDRALTFGSLNNWSKLTPEVMALWSEILLSVPKSRLLLKTRVLSDEKVRARCIAQFESYGVSSERLTLLSNSEDYLSTYHEIDIALDTFPRTGGATTADALWMGVPVLTLSGERMIERQGVSMLTAVGLEELIANTKDEYVEKAVVLAKDAERRKQLRGSLREQMAASPLCDARGLAQALEEAYRDMWRQYISRVGVSHDEV